MLLRVIAQGVAVVEPVLISMASAVASKAAVGLYDLVRAKLSRDAGETAILEAAVGADEDSPAVVELAGVIDRVAETDSEFAAALHAEWSKVSVENRGGDNRVHNDVSGTVVGKMVQARDVRGGISF